MAYITSSQIALDNFNISLSELENATSPNNSKHVFIIDRNGETGSKKFILKTINLDYSNSTIIDEPNPYEYYVNRNIFKEIRLTKMHIFRCLVPCKGYYVDNEKARIHFVFEYFPTSLETFIKSKSLNFINKMRLFKNLLEAVLELHVEGIASLDLSVNTLRFTAKKFNLKLVTFGNSLDMSSTVDIDKATIVNRKAHTVHTPPELFLNNLEHLNWHSDIWSLAIVISMMFTDKLYNIDQSELLLDYKVGKVPEQFYQTIDNQFLKAMIVGMLRIEPSERPNIFELIDVYNQLIKKVEYPEAFNIVYSKSQVLSTQ